MTTAKYTVEAYDCHGLQLISDNHGQGSHEGEGDYKETDWYKALNTFPSPGNRAFEYWIVENDMRVVEKLGNSNHPDWY